MMQSKIQITFFGAGAKLGEQKFWELQINRRLSNGCNKKKSHKIKSFETFSELYEVSLNFLNH